MQEKVIPIVYACDENFLRQTYVSIYSVLSNRKQRYVIKFFIMIPEGCEEKNYTKNWTFDNYSIEYISVSSNYFKDVKMALQNISKPTYYRLLIPMFLKDYDKCLYLDGDTICCDDINSLYEIDLEENLLAASKGAIVPFDEEGCRKSLNLPSAKDYINAGVLSMNLKQMRAENMMNIFLKCSERELPCQDQDVLYICCYNRIKILPLKYNIYSVAFNMTKEMLLTRYNESEMENALENPVIIHYPEVFAKPWNNINCVKSNEWWNYAVQVLEQEIIDEMYVNAANLMKKYDYHRLFEEISRARQIVIFGFSEIGQIFCNQLEEKYPQKVVCFCDNAKDKWDKEYHGYKVLNVAKIKQQYPEALIIITSQNYSKAIEKQLIQEEGFASKRVLVYKKKTIKYLHSMDRKYWEEVEEEIKKDDISQKECFG